jgi:transcriptional regulator with XRE-family HTH domain
MVGSVLRAQRQKVRLTQRELAGMLDLTPQFLNQIELGRRPLPQRLYEKLPVEIRAAVVKAAIDELRGQADRLRAQAAELRMLLKAHPEAGKRGRAAGRGDG